jgi:hypothetical protein
MLGSRDYFTSVRNLLNDKFMVSLHTLADNELKEAFTLPSFKGVAPEFAGNDLIDLQKIGDAAIDLALLRILANRNFSGDRLHDVKVPLVGNSPEQPLNRLFSEWKLERFVLGTETSYSPHQKADVVEALFGLLSRKGLLTDEAVERIFAAFLPKKLEKPEARKSAPKASEFAVLSTEALKIIIKLDRDAVRALSDDIIKVILEKIIVTPCGDIDPLISRLATIANEYKNEILFSFANNEHLSFEKFKKIFTIPAQRRAFPIHSDVAGLGYAPLKFLKLNLHFQIESYMRENLAKVWIRGLKTAASPDKAKEYAEALKAISSDLKGHDFLIAAYVALDKDKKALLPKFKPLEHLADCISYSEDDDNCMLSISKAVPKLLSLPPEDFKACFGLLAKETYLVTYIKDEIKARMKPPANEKTCNKYRAYLQCFEEAATPASPALVLATARGGAGAATSSPAP